jgi:hypothetical protein
MCEVLPKEKRLPVNGQTFRTGHHKLTPLESETFGRMRLLLPALEGEERISNGGQA